jgi:ATP-binding cassette subfamily B protein
VDPTLRWALGYLIPHSRRLASVLALSLAGTLLSLALPFLTRDLIDRAILARDVGVLVRVVSLFLVMTAASFLLNVWSGLRYTRVSADVLFDMRLALYRHLQRLSPRFYARTPLGEIVSRLNQDIGEIQRVSAEAALAWVGNIVFLAGTLGLMAWLDWPVLLVALGALPPSIWALAYHRRRLARAITGLRQSSTTIGSFLIETIQGMKLVVTSNAEVREAGRFRLLNDEFVASLLGMQRASYLANGLPGLVLAAGTSLVFLYGGLRVIDGAMTLGSFVAFMAYQMRLLAPIQALMGLYSSLAGARVSLGRVHELLGAAPEVLEAPRARALPSVRGQVAFEGVGLTLDRGAPVLRDVSFVVEPGESLAIVGPSGAGKSMIADLLLRLIDPSEGVVRLDGHDLRSLRLEEIRRHVALVDQAPFLLHTTIAENIRYARPEAFDAEVHAAARAAGLEAFVDTLPDRYDTIVGERGAALSAGEAQRVAIARALLANPAVLVLDEATAALDPATEREVVSGYQALMAGRTTIVITHRLQLALGADRVIVLEGAGISETGTPAELQSRPGAFATLFRVPLSSAIH